MPQAKQLLSLALCSAVMWCFFECGASIADQGKGTGTSTKTDSGSAAPASKEASSAPNPATLTTALGNIEKINVLVKAQNVSEALVLARSTQADVDKFLIGTFSQPNMLSAFPPDVVAAMKKNNAEPLCDLLNKELAAEQGGLENVRNLLAIRSNLKRIVTSLASMK